MQKLPGVANVELDADARTATVSVEAGKFSAADAVAALKNVSFPAETVTAIESASADAEGAEAPAEAVEAPAENAESEAATS